MLNHARTLLLNLSHDPADRSEHIPAAFKRVAFAPEIQSVMDILVPPSASRFQRKFIVHNLLQLISSAGLDGALALFDTRISYSLTEEGSKYFKTFRFSAHKSSPADSDVRLTPTGRYSPRMGAASFGLRVKVSQLDNTDNVKVENVDTAEVYSASTSVVWSGQFGAGSGLSQHLQVGNTGVGFTLFAPSPFTSHAGHSWTFLAEGPGAFDPLSLHAKLKSSGALCQSVLGLPSRLSSTSYEKDWQGHFNSLHQLAAFLLVLLTRMDRHQNA